MNKSVAMEMSEKILFTGTELAQTHYRKGIEKKLN